MSTSSPVSLSTGDLPDQLAADALIDRMLQSDDLAAILGASGLSPADALRLMDSQAGLRQRAARFALARIHVEVLAQRHFARAMRCLCELLEDQHKPHHVVRGALAILSHIRSSRPQSDESQVPDDGSGEACGDVEYGQFVAFKLAAQRRLQAMAPADDDPPEPPHPST